MRYSNQRVGLKKRNSMLPFMFLERFNFKFYMALLFITVAMFLSIFGVVESSTSNLLAYV